MGSALRCFLRCSPSALVAACIATSIACAIPVHAATYYVDGASPLASDTNAGTAAAPYKTISSAITARGAAGNIVLVKPASYRETVTLGVSGAAGNPFVIRATAPGVIVDGADDFASTAKWTLVSGNVYLAASVTWSPLQVFANGARLTVSTASAAALPALTYRYVSGTGLYVNASGGNPGTHATQVGRRTYGVRLSGRSWIVVDGLEVLRAEDRGIYLSSASNNVTLVRNTVRWSYKYAVYITGCSAATVDSNLVADNLDHGIYLASGTTGCMLRANEVARNAKPGQQPANGIYVNASPNTRLERNRCHDNRGSGIMVYSASHNTLSIFDRSWANGEAGFRISASTGVRLLGSVAHGNTQSGFALEGTSTGATLYNCIGTDNGLGAGGFDYAVASSAASGLVSDYNVWWNSTAQAPLQYGSTTCATIAAFRTASGKDARSTQADPKFLAAASGDFHLKSGSTAIDAANAAPLDWPALDADGAARRDDPTLANTGAGTPPFGDRGAFEFQNPASPPVAALMVTPSSGNAPLLVTLNASGSSDVDGGALSYRFTFGDGVIAGPQASSTITHPYAAGTWTASVTVTDNTGLTSTATGTVASLVPNLKPVPALTATYRAPGLITNRDTILDVPNVPRPPYLTPQIEPTFGAPLRRITGDAGTTFALPGGATGTWGIDSRHHYSKDQPWNADGTLIAIDNNGGTPIELFLDGRTYGVVKGRCSNYISGDDRWFPSPSRPNVRINIHNTELMWFDVVNCVKIRSWTLPFEVIAIGQGEGNPSNDGRFLALSDGARVFVVDMDPQPPLAPYPASRIGPALDVSNCGLPDGCGVGFVTVSASGKYVVVKYLNEHPRVFDIDPVTLALTPHPLPANTPICCAGSPSEGWIYDLGHPDLAVNPYDGNEDVIIGQEQCGNRGTVVQGETVGSVIMVRLRDGQITSLTEPTDEARAHHISARNLRRPGWVYIDYYADPNTRFDDEIVAVKMDGSHEVQRFAHKHTVATGCYRCESHAVPSPDGRRVMWASNWTGDCVSCGPEADIRAYVVDASNVFVPDTTVRQNIVLDATGSHDPDGTVASYRFLYGDGAAFGPSTEYMKSHDYRPGTWRASVTVTDNLAAKDSIALMLTVPPINRPPNGTITQPATDVTIAVGQSLTLAASASDPDGSAGLRFLWDLGGAGLSYFTNNPGTVPFNRVGTFVVRFLATDLLGLDDPTPDSVIVTVTPVNGRAPIVSAPATYSGTELSTIVVNVTATDLDGDPITSLIVDLTGLPAGNDATFIRNEASTAGTLTWTPSPTAGRAAPYNVTFTASNAQSGSATTVISVKDGVGPNLAPNPSFEFNTTGWGASGGATNVRVPGGKDGAYSLRTTRSTAPGMFGANDSPNIVGSTLAPGTRYRFIAWVKATGPAGLARLRIREYVAGVQVGPIVYSNTCLLLSPWQMLTQDFVTLAGGSELDLQILDDPLFPGESFLIDNVSVVIVPTGSAASVAGDVSDSTAVAPGVAREAVADGAASATTPADAYVSRVPLAASITPHPVSGNSTIRFATSRRGPLRLSLLDLSGRRVRTLLDDADAPAGLHQAVFARRGGDGTRLAAGVYFWRIEAGEGVRGGRLVVLE